MGAIPWYENMEIFRQVERNNWQGNDKGFIRQITF